MERMSGEHIRRGGGEGRLGERKRASKEPSISQESDYADLPAPDPLGTYSLLK